MVEDNAVKRRELRRVAGDHHADQARRLAVSRYQPRRQTSQAERGNSSRGKASQPEFLRLEIDHDANRKK